MSASDDAAIADMENSAVAPPSQAPSGGDGGGGGAVDPGVADMENSAVAPGQEEQLPPGGNVPPPPPAPRVRPAHAPGAPTRLRGEQPPPPAPAAAPGKPPPPEDLSALSVATGAVKNYLPSAANQLGQFIGALDPRNYPAEAEGIKQLATGAASKLGLLIPANAAQKAQDEASLNALGSMYVKRYGSLQNFKRTLKNDPAALQMDALAVLSIPAGGEGLAAEIPGTAGEILAGAARAARVGSEAISPISLTAKVAGRVLPGAARGSRLARYAGAGGEGGIMADETGQAALRTTARAKGASQAAANEAVIRAATGEDKAPLATSIVTRTAAPTDAGQEVADNAAAWRQRVGNAAADLGGANGEAPHPSAVGDALEAQQTAANNGIADAYQTYRSNPGKFAGGFAATAPGALNQAMTDATLPSLAEMAGSAKPGALGQLGAATTRAGLPAYEQTVKAANYLTQHLNDLAAADELTPANLMNARQQITGKFFADAKGGIDEKGLGTLLEGFDNHVANSAAAGMYAGGDGGKVATDMRNAIGAARGYKNTWESGPLAPAVKQITAGQVKDAAGRIVSGSAPGATTAAQDSLMKQIINQRTLASSPTAQQTYSALHGALGGEGSAGAEALNNNIRHTVTQTTPTGELQAKPDQIHNFLNGPMARSAFPDINDHSQLRRIAESQRMLTTKATAPAVGQGVVKSLAARGARMAGAAAIGHLTGHNPLLGMLGEQLFIEPMFAKGAARAAMRGAPRRLSLNPLRGAGAMARYTAERPGRSALASRLYGALPVPGTELAARPAGPGEDTPSAWHAPRGGAYDRISDVAKRNGASDDEIQTLQHIARFESNGNPAAVSKSKRYRGLFQYPNGGDPDQDTVRALGDLRRNENKLADLGVEPSASNLYLMHQQGPAGGPALLTAAPGTNAVDALTPAYRGNRALARMAIAHNIGMDYSTPAGEAAANARAESMTAQDFVNQWNDKWRTGRAAGGLVVDMTEHLMKRAERAQKAARTATKPLLGLSDDVVARALNVAQRGI
jgi:hypothetical protein